MRTAGLAAAALAAAVGASASMHSSSAGAPATPASPEAVAFARQLTPPPFNTLDTLLAHARQAQAQRVLQPTAADPVPVDFTALHLLLSSVKASK